MIPTLYVDHLTPEEIITLKSLHSYHPKSAARRRAQIILLNDKGKSVKNMISILGLNRQAIAVTINKWKSHGICGLFDKSRKGRPKTLMPEQESDVIELVHLSPRNLKNVVNEIEKQMGIKVGISVVKRLCKKAGLT